MYGKLTGNVTTAKNIPSKEITKSVTKPIDFFLSNVNKDNWNEHGAKAFNKSHIELCNTLLNMLPYQPEIFPTANGSIQLEYDGQNESYLEFEVFPEYVAFYLVDQSGNESSSVIDLSSAENTMISMVSEFYG